MYIKLHESMIFLTQDLHFCILTFPKYIYVAYIYYFFVCLYLRVGCSAFSAASIITKDVLKIACAYDLFSSKTYTYIWGFPYLLTFPKNTCFFFFFLLFICVGWSTFSAASIITIDVLKTASVYDLSNSKRN